MNERDRGFFGTAAGTVLTLFLVILVFGFLSHKLGWSVDKQKVASLPQTTPVVSVVTNMKPVDSGESPATNVPSGEGARVATNTVASKPKVAIHADLNKFRRQLEVATDIPVMK